MNLGLLAEPGELALGVAARGLGNRFCGGGDGDGTLKVRAQFAVSNEVEWLRVKWNAAADQAVYLFEPPLIHHRVYAVLDAVVQRGPRRLQADLDWSISFQPLPPGPEDFGLWTSRKQANFNGANHLRAVAGPNSQSGLGVQTPQDTMQILETASVRARFQARAQCLGARGGVGQPFQQRTQVQPGADG